MTSPKTIRLLLIPLLISPICQAVAAFQATRVLLPATDISQPATASGKLRIAADGSSPIQATSTVQLGFNLGVLPADARISRVTLRLEGTPNNANPQLVKLFTRPNGQGPSQGKWTAVGERRVFSVASEALLKAVTEKHRSHRPLDLWLRSTSRFSDWVYASTRSFGDKPGAKPRLIVHYSRDLPAPLATERTGWRYFGETNRFRIQPLRSEETLLTQPVFYRNGLYLFARPDASAIHLLALNTNGRERWRSGVKQAPGGHVTVDPDGQLRAIGRQRVARYDLRRRGVLTANTSVKDLQPTLTPTQGLDDSLYVSVSGHLHGLDPQLQEVWRYPQGRKETTFSPVTLSSTGQAQAFVLTRQENKNYLTTIDIGSGEWREQAFDAKYDHFHPPLVIPDPSGDYVCLAVNSQQDGLLSCHAGGQRIWSVNGPVSRPLDSVDGKRLYVVQSGCLRALDRFNGTEQASSCPAKSGLAATSNLVSDGDSNIYFWNNGKLLSFDRDCRLLAEQPLDGLAESLQLLFAPDGTLFAVNPKTRQLASLLPDRPFLTLNQANLRNRTQYAAERLTIAPNTRLGAKTEIALKARKGIAIGPGFSVERGAILSLGTGY